jgi:virulence factor Mce-like protein
MTRRPSTALVASPVLVGAVTVLVACVSVLLAVQANSGLPFVPTYDLKAELPGGNNLVVGNEVRIGGFRVGVVKEIRPAIASSAEEESKAEQRAIAVVDMKLDKEIEPLPNDTRLVVRPRSALGLKYIQMELGDSDQGYAAGATIPLASTTKPIELDEFFSLNNEDFRKNLRTVFEGYGDGLTGRGAGINQAIEDLVPFTVHLEPVFRALSDPATELDEFFKQAGRTSAQIAPVAETYSQLFTNMGTTFEALSRHPDKLRGTIERAAPTLEEAIRSFPVQRPFLADVERLNVQLEPLAVEFERSMPPATRAFRVGAPVLERAPVLYRNTEKVFAALDELAENPNTLLALQDLDTTLDVLTPLVEYVAPYQTVCDYWVYFWTGLSEHVSEIVPGGTAQRTNLKSDNRTQDNRLSSSEAERPVDVPAGQDPQTAKAPNGDDLQALHNGAYSPSIDGQGNADCRIGQRGYLAGPFIPNGRYGPNEDGGQHVVLSGDTGILSGGTYKARELGIDNVKDVP